MTFVLGAVLLATKFCILVTLLLGAVHTTTFVWGAGQIRPDKRIELMKMKGTLLNFIFALVAVFMIFLFLGNVRAEQDGSMGLPSLFTTSAQTQQSAPLNFEVLHTYPCALPDENGNIGGYDRMCAEIVFLDDGVGVIEPAEPAVLSFIIFDADLDQPIGELTSGMVLDGDDLTAFTVAAETQGEFTNIIFDLYEVSNDGTQVLLHNHVEGQPPYSLYGDSGDDYEGGLLSEGSYELHARTMIEGEAVSTYSVAFNITD